MSNQDLLKKALFVPCHSKEDLHRWIKVYLGLDIPDCTVAEESNSNPMEVIWEVYSKCINNDVSDITRLMAYASRDSFKCQHKGAKLMSRENGIVNIEDVKIGETIWSGFGWRKVTNWFHEGVKKATRVDLTDGSALVGSPVHRYWCWSPGSMPGWKCGSELTPNDYVMADTSHDFFTTETVGEEFNEGYLCGILQGDGGLSYLDRYHRVSLTGMPGKPVDFFLDFCKKQNVNVKGRKQFTHSKATTYTFYSKKLCVYLKSLGLEQGLSFEKKIPASVWKSKSRMAGFVTGLFDTDGHYSTWKTQLVFALTAKSLVSDLQILMRALGVDSHFHPNKDPTNGNKRVYVLTVGAWDIPNLIRAGVKIEKGNKATKIPAFDILPKNYNVKDSLSQDVLQSLLSKFPKTGGKRSKTFKKPTTSYETVSRQKCLRLVEYGEQNGYLNSEEVNDWKTILKNKWVKVSSVTETESDLYDLTVEKDHSYWSDGFVSHNTLSAAVLETLMILHLDRPVVHLSAILQQSKKSQEYVKSYFNRPLIRDYKVKENERQIEYVRYYNAVTGDSITEKEWEALPTGQGLYEKKQTYIQIIVATLQSTNSAHVPFLCVDGESEVLVEIYGSNRKRRSRKIKDVFLALKGLKPSGRRGKPQPDTIVPQKEIKVLSADANGNLSMQRITKAKMSFADCIRLDLSDGKSIACTPSHEIFTLKSGYIKASELKIGDCLVSIDRAKTIARKSDGSTRPTRTSVPPAPSQDWKQVLRGSLLGDCGIYKRQGNNPYIREQHSKKQQEYIDWKFQALSPHLKLKRAVGRSGYTGEEQPVFYSANDSRLLEFLNIRKDLTGLEDLNEQGLAVWYMDDGCAGNSFGLSTEGFSEEHNLQIVDFLKKRFGIHTHIEKYRKFIRIRGGVEAKRRLTELCTPFIQPSMTYKFDLSKNRKDCPFCGQEFWPYESDGLSSKTCGSPYCIDTMHGKFKSPQIIKISQIGQRAVYDIAVENNNNFFANGVLVHNCVDEIDVIANPKAYEEAKFIPAPWGNKLPVTFLTSTRKFSYGLVQKELDEADETHLAVRHWNIIDVTQPCLPERHQPEKPKEKLWVYDEEIRHVTDAEYQNLDPEIQKDFVQHEGYAGCAKCPLFAACKGQLATKQFCKSKLLKPIEHTINLFRSASIGSANAQLLCRKPDTSGLIYPYLDKAGHMKTAAEIMAMVSTDATNIKTKAELISWFLSNGANFYSGMDFGFTHDFAVVTGAVWGNYLFVLDCIGIANLELDDKIQACEKLRYINPIIFGDPESPSDIETFRKKGKFRMRKWVKGPGSVKAGIETVRSKLRPAIGKPTMFFLKDDLGVAALVEQLSKYHFKLDAAGNVTDEPAKENDDRADACRYLVMNVFNNKGKIIASFEGNNAIGKTVHLTDEQARNSEMLDIVRNYLDNSSDTTTVEEDEPKEKKSKFVFDI